VLEVGGGRLEALNLIPQASPLKQFPSFLQPQTSNKIPPGYPRKWVGDCLGYYFAMRKALCAKRVLIKWGLSHRRLRLRLRLRSPVLQLET
jgi:hypothetical protein